MAKYKRWEEQVLKSFGSRRAVRHSRRPFRGERGVQCEECGHVLHPTHNFGLVVGEEVDLGRMAGKLLGLAERAEAAGDARRAWTFDQWYAWACAAMRGEEYHWPELPQALEALP